MWIVLLDTVYVSIFHIVTVTVIAIVLTKLQLQLQQCYSYVLLSVQKKSSWRTSLVISMNKEATSKCHRETQKHRKVKIGGKKPLWGEKKTKLEDL